MPANIVVKGTTVNVIVGGALRGPQGLTGATGATGPAGSNGTDGQNGAQWYQGAGAPSTLHTNGDFYLNTTNGDVYEQVAGSWGSPVGNIKGPAGDMAKATYDPTNVSADAFAMDNMVQGTTNKFITAAEKTVLDNTSGVNTGDQTSVTGNAGTATKLATARTIDGQSFDGSANITVIAPATHAATSKTTPVDADEFALVDSAASFGLKKLTWTNLKATAKTYFDTLYAAISHTHAESDITNLTTDLAAKAPTASPTFTGTVTLPTGLTGLAKMAAGVLSAVTAPSGAVVGTTDTQTLTNKTMSGASNTFSSIPESAVTNLTTDLSGKVPTSTTVNGHPLSSNVTVTASDVSLGNVPNVKQNLSATTAPAVTDDSGSGYAIGSRWINTTTDKEYVCTDASTGAASWVETTSVGGGGGDMVLAATQTVTGPKTFNAGMLLDKGEVVYDVYAYGAVGNGVTDDTTAIQNAINDADAQGGGTVFFPLGTYLITTALALKSSVNLVGAASTDNASSCATIKTSSTSIHILSGINTTASLSNVRIENLRLEGPGSGTGHGIYLQNTGSAGVYPPFFMFALKNVEIASMGGYGFNAESLIVSSLQNVICQSCGTGGFYLNGAAHGTATTVNTSVNFISCYANACTTYGFNISDSTYINFSACAADDCGTAYYCLRGNGIAYVASGCEWSNPTSASPADGFVADGSYGISYVACFSFQNKHYSIKAVNNATNIGVYNFNENSPVSATNSVNADSTSVVSSYGSVFQTATGGTGIVVKMDDGVGNAQLYKAYVNSPTNTTKSVVSIDATQTLTNKTMSGASNTFSSIPESAITNLTTDLAAKVPTTRTVAGNALSADVTQDQITGLSSTGIIKRTAANTLAVATAGTDYYNPGGTDVAVADGGTGASTASGARTNLGLVIGTDVVAPNQDTTGKSAKTDALNSATTTINVSSATAPSAGQVLTATSSTAATWQTPSGGGGSSTPQFSIRPTSDESYWDSDSTSGTYVKSHNSKGYHHGCAQLATVYGKIAWLTNGNLPSGALKNMTGYLLGSLDNPGGTAYGTYYLKFFSEAASSSFNTVTVNHIGLKFATSTGPSYTASSTVGNGTSGTTTTLASINPGTTDHLYTFKQPTVAAGDVTFYVDGSSANVHSTNQPTFAANSQFLGFHVAGGAGSGNFTLNFREMALQGDMY